VYRTSALVPARPVPAISMWCRRGILMNVQQTASRNGDSGTRHLKIGCSGESFGPRDRKIQVKPMSFRNF
jgi:hypothetical protein